MRSEAIFGVMLAAIGCVDVHVDALPPRTPARTLVDLTHVFDAETIAAGSRWSHCPSSRSSRPQGTNRPQV